MFDTMRKIIGGKKSKSKSEDIEQESLETNTKNISDDKINKVPIDELSPYYENIKTVHTKDVQDTEIKDENEEPILAKFGDNGMTDSNKENNTKSTQNVKKQHSEELTNIYKDAEKFKMGTNASPLEIGIEEELKKIEGLREQSKIIKAEIHTLTKQRDMSADEIKKFEASIDSTREELNRLQIEREQCKGDLQKFQASIDSTREELNRLQIEREQCKGDLQKFQASIDSTREELNRLQIEREQYIDPKFQTSIDSTREELNRLQREHATIKSDIARLVIEKQTISNRTEHVEKAPSQDWFMAFDQLRSTTQKNQSDYQFLNYRIDSVLDQIREIKISMAINARLEHVSPIKQPQPESMQPEPQNEKDVQVKDTKQEADKKENEHLKNQEQFVLQYETKQEADKKENEPATEISQLDLANAIKEANPNIFTDDGKKETQTITNPSEHKKILDAACKIVAATNAKLRQKEIDLEKAKRTLESEIDSTSKSLEKERRDHKQTKEQLMALLSKTDQEVNQ